MTTVFNNNSFEEYLEDAGRRAVWLGRELAEEEARVLRNIPAELEEVVEEDVGGVLSALNQAGGAEAVIARGIAGVLVGEEVVVGTGAAIVGGVAVAAVTAICSAFYITLWEFGWGGFAWPDTYWKNEQTIDLKDGDDKKPWLMWTEEGTGQVWVYPYATREDAHNASTSWVCDRVLMKWDATTAQPKEMGRWGPGLAKSTIDQTANSAMHKQYQKNVDNYMKAKGLSSTSVSVEDLIIFCKRFQAWKAKQAAEAEAAIAAALAAALNPAAAVLAALAVAEAIAAAKAAALDTASAALASAALATKQEVLGDCGGMP